MICSRFSAPADYYDIRSTCCAALGALSSARKSSFRAIVPTADTGGREASVLDACKGHKDRRLPTARTRSPQAAPKSQPLSLKNQCQLVVLMAMVRSHFGGALT